MTLSTDKPNALTADKFSQGKNSKTSYNITIPPEDARNLFLNGKELSVAFSSGIGKSCTIQEK